MSWKNLVSVAACALLASPALAVPSLQIESGGLNASGNWIWNVSVTPDTALFNLNPAEDPVNEGGSIAVELGLTASGANLVSAATNPGVPVLDGNVENFIPGNGIFGWEIEEDTDPGVGVNMRPVGLQIGTGADSNEVFAALGTTYFISGGPKHILTIITQGPSTAGSLTSTLSLSDLSIIAQNDGIAGNDDTYDFAAGSATRTVLEGDANLSGGTNITDLSILAANFNDPGSFTWSQGDFNGSTGGVGEVNITDLSILAAKFNQNGGSNNPLNSVPAGAGAGGSAAVPEPASMALAALALLAGLGLVRRK